MRLDIYYVVLDIPLYNSAKFQNYTGFFFFVAYSIIIRHFKKLPFVRKFVCPPNTKNKLRCLHTTLAQRAYFTTNKLLFLISFFPILFIKLGTFELLFCIKSVITPYCIVLYCIVRIRPIVRLWNLGLRGECTL